MLPEVTDLNLGRESVALDSASSPKPTTGQDGQIRDDGSLDLPRFRDHSGGMVERVLEAEAGKDNYKKTATSRHRCVATSIYSQ